MRTRKRRAPGFVPRAPKPSPTSRPRARYAALRTARVALHGLQVGDLEQRADLLERLWRAGERGTSDYLVQLKESLGIALSEADLEAQVWQAWFDYLASAGRLVDWLEGRPQEVQS
jgi:cobalt-zinc-cadmium efflux system outer membrane protein